MFKAGLSLRFLLKLWACVYIDFFCFFNNKVLWDYCRLGKKLYLFNQIDLTLFKILVNIVSIYYKSI